MVAIESLTSRLLCLAAFISFALAQVSAPSTAAYLDSSSEHGDCYFWLEHMPRLGRSSFASDASYQVFRNVKDYGAVGDGVTDDSAAINAAISTGNRCLAGACNSTTTTPALVYFPAGTYLVTSPIIVHYYTHVIGNPNCLPTIKVAANYDFRGAPTSFVVDANPYQPDGKPGFMSTNVFWRQMKNFIIDLTAVPPERNIKAVHWNAGQANSLQNLVIKLSQDPAAQQTGIFIEDGSAGTINDIIITGGLYGAWFGSQQFTMRNITITNAKTAIKQDWDWGWTYIGLSIADCELGIEMSSKDPQNIQSVAALTMIDSSISRTSIGIKLLWNLGNDASFVPGSSLVLENVDFSQVSTAIASQAGTVLGSYPDSAPVNLPGWMQGNSYAPSGHGQYQGPIVPNARPSQLLSGGRYLTKIHPQYEDLTTSQFLSVKANGAVGDGRTDDTAAIQDTINRAQGSGLVVFFDAGTYVVTSTIQFPAGSIVTGEVFPVIMSRGSFFADMDNPQPVVRVGEPGESGLVEWSNMIVSTQGAQAGAVLIEWNLKSSEHSPSGMWDVHTRIGGFAGSDLLLADCPKQPEMSIGLSDINQNCIAAFASMRITASAAGLYMSNVWLWVADHDIEDSQLGQITIYAGRGLLIESQGPIWLFGTAVEHHVMYEYSFQSAGNIFAGFIQTETAYFQPNPPAPYPFTSIASWQDPSFPSATTAPAGWALYIGGTSENILIYGAGLYAFFNNYNLRCAARDSGPRCQTAIFLHQGTGLVSIYGLSTVGTTYMATREVAAGDIQNVAYYGDNLAGFSSSIALYRWDRE